MTSSSSRAARLSSGRPMPRSTALVPTTGSVRSACFGALRTATVEAMEARLAQSDAVQGCRIGTDGNTGDPRDR
jgi:hypothetical protein